MAVKKIVYNNETQCFSLVNKLFSDYDSYDIEEFKVLKKLLDESSAEEFAGRYGKLLFKNQPKTYYVFFPPKSGGGQPHVELSVHPESTFNFSEVFNPGDFIDTSIRVVLSDKRRFRSLSISHRDYDLLTTFFDMEVAHKNQLRLGSNLVKIEDIKTDFYKIIDTINKFNEKFHLNDIKKIFPFDQLNENLASKGKDIMYTVKFLKSVIRISMLLNRKPIMIMTMDSKGHIILDINESIIESVIGNTNGYKLTFEPIFNCGKFGFTDVTVNSDMSDKLSPIKDIFKDYKEGNVYIVK